jgi:tetratricopeptide (TPR) repeat protein
MLICPVLGIQQEQEQAPPPDETQAPQPVKPPRVVGQPQSQEEWDAWQAIDQAAMPEKRDLALAFLERFPESGLTANVNYLLARYYDQIGDVQSYIKHAEATLVDLPDTVDFLARLAFFYSEQRKTSVAMKYANRVLEIADTLEKPDSVTATDFVTQRSRLKAEANYALGRSSLNSQNWVKSAEYLKEALKHDPKHDYACFRLALAERNLNHAGEALLAYARAVAIGSVAAGPSQAELEKLLQIVKDNMPDSEWASKTPEELVQMAAQQMQEDTARLEDELALQAQEIEAANTGLGIDLPPPPPPPGR